MLSILISAGCGEKPAVVDGRQQNNPAEKNVLLITIDTCRADRLQSYGNKNINTPAESSLALLGTTFTSAIAPAPITLPSHASILTGNYPPVHGVRDNGMFRLSDEALTLSEVLKHSGYRTGAFIGAFVLDSQFGLDQGFDFYDDDPAGMGRKDKFLFAERKAEAVAGSALNWIQKEEGKPFFAWLHFFDPHKEYSPPEPFSEIYENNLYDGEIAYVDSVIGQFLDVLNKNGHLSDTLIILTADHGESLGEHGEETHGLFIYDATMKVPLIMVLEGEIPANRRIHKQVGLIDIMPTVVDILGLPAVVTDGRSLRSLFKGGNLPDTALYIESFMPQSVYNWAPFTGIRTGSWKYISSGNDEELYFTEIDFWETDNIISENTETAEEMRILLNKFNKSFPEGRQPPDEVLNESAEKKLRSLGYLGGSATVSKSVDLTKNEMLGIMSGIIRANNMAKGDQKTEAIKELRSILKLDPGNTDAQRLLGQTLLDTGQFSEAQFNLEKAIKISAVFDPMLYLNLAQALEAQGNFPEAVEKAEHVINNSENIAEAYWIAGRIALKQGKTFAAEEHLKTAVKISGKLHEARLLLGRLYLDNGEFNEAIKHFGILIESLGTTMESPEILTDAYLGAGMVQLETGRVNEAEYFFDQSLKIAPLNTAAVFELGKLYHETGKEKELAPYLKKYLELSPEKDSADYAKATELLNQISSQ